jgi:hypothetical protein
MSGWNLLAIGLFLSMEVLCGLSRWPNGWHNWRPGGAIRGKWRIIDLKEEEWSDPKFGAPRWWPPLVSVTDWSSGPGEQVWVVYWHIRDFMGSYKLSSSMCHHDGSYHTTPNGCTVCPLRYTCGRRALGWGGPWSSLWPRCELLPPVVPFWPTCVVLSGYYPCKV